MSFWSELEDQLNSGEQCPAGWVTSEWDPDLASKVMLDHRCILAPHATGNHRDAAGNVRVRFEE